MGSIYHVEKEWSSAFQRVTNSRTRTGFACFCFVTFRGRLVFPMFEPGATTITKHKRRRRRRDRKTCSSSIFWFYYFLFEFFSSFARSPKTMERVRTLFVLPSVFVYRSSSFLSLFIFFFFLCDFIFHCRVAPPTRSMSGCVNPPQREILCWLPKTNQRHRSWLQRRIFTMRYAG